MKIIFLDLDGVLNSGNYIKQCDNFDDPIQQLDAKAVDRLNRITDATGAVIVVSSTWRLAFKHSADPLRQLQGCLAAYKITAPVIGMTPDLQSTRNRRGKEIQSWIDDHYNEIEKFVIIDDDTDMGRLGPHLIKTLFEDGLQDSHVERIVDILNKIPVPL